MEFEVTIEVQGERIMATLPGTEFAIVFRRTCEGLSQLPVMSTDRNAPCSNDKFEKIAWEAAFKKAQELGWVTPGSR